MSESFMDLVIENVSEEDAEQLKAAAAVEIGVPQALEEDLGGPGEIFQPPLGWEMDHPDEEFPCVTIYDPKQGLRQVHANDITPGGTVYAILKRLVEGGLR